MTYNKKTIEDIAVAGKKVLVRCDFNVPVKDGVITSDKRIVEALPTIKYLKAQGAMVILCSHMGKPHNVFDAKLKLDKKEIAKIDALPEEEREAATAAALEKAKKDVKKLSLQVVADKLNELLGGGVVFAHDTVGEDAKAKVAAMKPGDIVLLENTRFTAREEKNDPEFSKELASLAEIFVNDAFGTAHRAHASTAGVTQHAGLPAVCGYLIQKEISVMGKALANPERPFVAILGGAKVSDKLNVISNLLTKVDTLIIGGGMAYTFLAAKGYTVGQSLLDVEKIDYCKDMMAKAEANGVKLLLPVDTTIAASFPNPIDGPIEVSVVDSDKIPDDMQGLDIGPKTMELYAEAAKSAKTVVWNGPMGVFENPTLAKGTIAVAEALAESEAISIVGGGDSAAACEQLGFADRITHISTGGGASLEFLEGKDLPGISCLADATRKIVIAGNWKMNFTPSEATAFINEIKPMVAGKDNCDIIFCAPYVTIAAAQAAAAGSNIKIGAENVHFADKGAYTGEVSAKMLTECGVKYVIIGHSERRQYFAETDETVNKRVKAALAAGMTVILCLGEVKEQRLSGITKEIVSMQTKLDLAGVSAEEMKRVIIAYEPVWAIGTGLTATPEQADETCGQIRDALAELYGKEVADLTTIQYGGSMNDKNAAELLSKPNVDGGLIGGASLVPAKFTAIVDAAQ